MGSNLSSGQLQAENYWPCAGGSSAVKVVGAQMPPDCGSGASPDC